MAKKSKGLLEIECPCCHASLKVDTDTSVIISHKEKEKPRSVEDLETAVVRLQGEAGRREDAFQKSVAEHKVHKDVLAKKFDELFRQAKENPDEPPPLRDIDID